ncbi:MAG TPA: HD domain-containing phosphohydrolase [Ktedonobacteraceae bacterium]|nr:HD domain-containing phosphohydrolase [Ktedonobacteraceae bacterium]
MHTSQTTGPGLRLAELIASLSLAIDLGLGQPMEHFLRTCLLAVRLGELLDLSEQELSEVYYLGLIRHLGCTAQASEVAAVCGDEIALNSWLLAVDQGRPTEMLAAFFQNLGKGESALRRTRLLVNALATVPWMIGGLTVARCEVARHLAERLGLASGVRDALGQMYERWDGKGLPNKLKGEAILLPVRVVQLAQDAELFSRLGGTEAAVTMARKRAGGLYDPHLVERFCQQTSQLLEKPNPSSLWEAVLAAEPGPHPYLAEADLDRALRAVADFVDLKSPYTVGHSSGVAELAAEAAQRYGLPEADVETLRRAGWLHDLGRIGVSNTIWDKPGPLSEAEWEHVRLHPYYTERVLVHLKGLGQVGVIAAQNHERLDGSGYHRGIPATMLPMKARILAVADIYHALTEPRPYRIAQSANAAASELRSQVRGGLLDDEAVRAVLMVAGHRLRSTRHEWVAGLTDREIEVLRLVARGHSNRQMATLLSISASTIHHHIQHIYAKIGVSTRAAATLFAMQHHLLNEIDEAKK